MHIQDTFVFLSEKGGVGFTASGFFLDFCSVFHFSFYHTFAGNTSSEPLMMDCCSAAEKCWICLKIVRKGLALGHQS